MHANHSKLPGLYDELPMFLTQINVFRGKGLSDYHELAVFLQLYGANPYMVRKTGKQCYTVMIYMYDKHILL